MRNTQEYFDIHNHSYSQLRNHSGFSATKYVFHDPGGYRRYPKIQKGGLT